MHLALRPIAHRHHVLSIPTFRYRTGVGTIRAGFECLLAAAGDGRLVDPCERHGVRLLGAFGSATRGEVRYDSLCALDVAVAFHDDRPRDLLSLLEELAALSECDRIDLLDLHRADPSAREEGLRGVPLYEAEPGGYAQALMVAAQGRLDSVWLRRLRDQHEGGDIPESFDPALVRPRVAMMEQLLQDLRQLLRMGPQRLTEDRLLHRALERILLHLIQLAVNLNAYASAALMGTAPRSHHGSFAAVAQTGLIAPALAEDLAPSAGLRSLLVYEPAGVEPARLLQMGARMLDCYGSYVRQVSAFLDRRERVAPAVPQH